MSSVDRGGASHPLVELTLARLREFMREPEALFWTFFFPIVMTLAMAIAFPSRGARPVPIGIAAGGDSSALRSVLEQSPGLALRELPPGGEARALREGVVHVIVVPTTPPTYRFDAARDESRLARLVVDDALKRAAGRTDPWSARDEPLAVAGSRYIDWLVPGLIGMGIMSNGMWSICFSIVQSRLRKLLKRMVASPMRRRDYLLAHMLARLVFLVAEVAIPLGFAVMAFGMPVNGSPIAVAAVALLGALTFGALGLLLASRVKTIEAISGLMNLAMLPMWIVSGVFFSSANFPAAIQPAIQVLPLTALNDALRAVILDGAALADIGGEIGLLTAWGVIPFFVTLRIFRWR